MSPKEFRQIAQNKWTDDGVKIWFAEPIDRKSSKVFAVTKNLDTFIIGVCDHTKRESVIMKVFGEYNSDSLALQKFLAI